MGAHPAAQRARGLGARRQRRPALAQDAALFSRRLDWLSEENALAQAEAAARAAGRTIIDLTLSNPTLAGLPARGPALAAALADPAVGAYHPHPLGAPAARAAVAAEYARLGAAVDPDQLVLSASSSEAYAWLWKLLCDPGEAVLVPEPSYPLFAYLAGLEGVTARPYRLVFAGEWQIDWASVEHALPGARAVVVVNPNNPTGSFLRAGDLRHFSTLAASHDAALVVDEVFADYAFAPPREVVRTVAAAGALPALTFALGGLSKASGLPQMKLGWTAVLGPPALRADALARLALIADTYLSVGTPVLRALPRLLPIGEEIRRDITARVAANRATLAALLSAGSPVTWLPAEGGWSAILRLPATRSDEAWALALLEADGVLVQPGYFFDLTGVGTTVVVSLLGPPAAFAAGLTRLLARANAG